MNLMSMLELSVAAFADKGFDYYQQFLDFCAKNNLHRFSPENQFLIFWQKPQAELCVSYEIWKQQARRPKRATGIQIFPEKFQTEAYHVFDIKDTYAYGEEKDSLTWSFSAQDRKNLTHSFAGANDFSEMVDVLVQRYLSKQNSSWQSQNAGDLTFLKEVSSYIILKRCGEEVAITESAKNFYHSLLEDVSKFIGIHITVRATVHHVLHILWRQYQLQKKQKREETNEREERSRTLGISRGAERNENRRGISGQHDQTGGAGVPEGIPGVYRKSREGGHGQNHGLSENRPADGANRDGLSGGTVRGRTVPSNVPVPDDRNHHERKSEGSREITGGNRGGISAKESSKSGRQFSKDFPDPDRGKTDSNGRSHSGGLNQTYNLSEVTRSDNDPMFSQLSLFSTEDTILIENKNTEEIPKEEPLVSPLHVQKTEEEATTEIRKTEGTPFFYPDNWQPNDGGDKSRFQQNLLAIQTLKEIESENRTATQEEQLLLSHYVGWGGLSNVFDERKSIWSKEYETLKELLSSEEYDSARASVTDSFYTPKEVLDGVYKALDRMGFSYGTILEPSLGIGNFYAAMPEDMRKKSRLFGVELDSISGRIAKQLHPDADIQICGLEKSNLPDNYFDVIIGNVPFGDFSVYDPDFSRENFKIHDYFFAKAVKKLRPGGLLALITSKGTLDKKNSKVRSYLAERAELLGAVRLPNTTFQASANTDATSDILFLKKKEALSLEEADWLSVKENDQGIPLNLYYVNHPDMLLGTMKFDYGRFGSERYTALFPKEGTILSQELARAVQNLPEKIYSRKILEETKERTIPADPNIKDFCFGIAEDGQVYYRENSIMTAQKPILSPTTYERVKGMCRIRTAMHGVIDLQLSGCTEEELKTAQTQLNQQYDMFTARFGYLNEKENMRVMRGDVDAMLLCSLEKVSETKVEKADIFSRATIRPNKTMDHTDSARDALYIVLNETGQVDLLRIMQLCRKDFDHTIKELTENDAVFLNPSRASEQDPYAGWEAEEEYLSGNIREKLRVARLAAKTDEKYLRNVQKLSETVPKDLEAEDITVRIGTVWIAPADYEKFLQEFFHFSFSEQRGIHVNFEKISNTYFITNKSAAQFNDMVRKIYGTDRISGLEIVEALLNLRQIQIYDTYEDGAGKTQRVLNQKETMIAKSKAGLIADGFQNWIFQDLERREKYVRYYNDTFNSCVTRHYDGSYLTFPGMSQIIQLKPHQKDAVARIVRGGNTLLAHCVGAGKSFEMAAGCMELKRLGLASKPLVVVPKHLTGQMAVEFLTLYPNASLLLATEQDFEKKNRQKFIAKIATGTYDAVIMGHSQLEKIGLSKERQIQFLEQERKELMDAIKQYQYERQENWTVKNLERQRKRIDSMLEKMQREEYKESLITFEELGVDAIFIDEAHNYKNLSFTTKMTRLPGINPEGSKKSMDLLMKIQYLQEKNPGRNIVFATGTPISNSMCELYTMQRYLQADRLKELGIYHFDAWAANFGETQSALELAPEGGTYRMRTRFNKFVNLPELMALYHEFADVQLPDMLNLPVPKLKDGKYSIVESQPNEEIREYMASFIERADKIHNGLVEPNVDNMLKICHDARLLGTDIRLLDPMAKADPNGKLYQCADKVYQIYQKTQSFSGTQIIFSDIGIPKSNEFNVYDFIRDILVKKGIPKQEICFIHEAKTDKQREKMFEDMRTGKRRIILGSTQKMGTGTNIQKRLYAMHEIDVPWRPADVEQREGRILRQGNRNQEVEIYRYVTKGTFDAYNWALIENKQRFISQVMTSKSTGRTCDDVDEAVLNYAEMKAVASDNPDIKKKMEVDRRIQEIQILKKDYETSQYRMQKDLKTRLPQQLEQLNAKLASIRSILTLSNRNEDYHYLVTEEKNEKGNITYPITLNGKRFQDASLASDQIDILASSMKLGESKEIGTYLGLRLAMKKEDYMGNVKNVLYLSAADGREFRASDGIGIGSLRQLKNYLLRFPELEQQTTEAITNVEENIRATREEIKKPFLQERELEELRDEQLRLEQKLSERPEKTEPATEQEKVKKCYSTVHRPR